MHARLPGPAVINHIRAREILDSRGRPTVEADVELENGALGRVSVPSGASTGAAEARELRDGDRARYEGLGVTKAVAHVNGEIAAALRGMNPLDQPAIDRRLRELDGTAELERLGANAVLAVSLAVCRAAALMQGRPLYLRIAELARSLEPRIPEPLLPLPMVNILSGGLHAAGGMDVQDLLAIPLRGPSFHEALEILARVRSAATRVAARRGLPTLLADEGGLSPGLPTAESALDMLCECIEAAHLKPGVDVAIAIDVAATTLRGGDSTYRFEREGRDFATSELIAKMEAWVRNYPVISIEDGLHEEDWAGWAELTHRLGQRTQLVGDDLFATHRGRLQRGMGTGAANAVLIKANQNGTLTGTLEVIAAARAGGYRPIVSARSGETEDNWLADLAVGTAAGQIKVGSLRTSSTLAKYNQLLRIGQAAGLAYAGAAAVLGHESSIPDQGLRLSSTPLPMGSSTESSPSSRTRRR